MQQTIEYAYNLRASQLVHYPANSIPFRDVPNRNPSNPRSVPEKCAFDPHDLTRRLQLVIAERQAYKEKSRQQPRPPSATQAKYAHAQRVDNQFPRLATETTIDTIQERRRKTRAAHHHDADSPARTRRPTVKVVTHEQPAQQGSPKSGGPYVPRVAASQFTLTTLGDSPVKERASIHRQYRASPKYHTDPFSPQPLTAPAAPEAVLAEQAKAIGHARSFRDRHHGRNSFQVSAISEGIDSGSGLIHPKRCSIYAAPFAEQSQPHASRRKSTGSFMEKDFHPPPARGADLASIVEAHRVDWTQSDEKPNGPKSASLCQNSKPDSKWNLRGRLNSFHKPRDGKTSSSPVSDHPPKSPVASFLARLKR